MLAWTVTALHCCRPVNVERRDTLAPVNVDRDCLIMLNAFARCTEVWDAITVLQGSY